MSRVWISKPVVSRIEEEAMSLSGFHYKLYLCFYSLSLSQFQLIFVSFVAISAALYRCLKAMFCLSKFSPTWPKESGQNKCNQRRPTKGWSYTKHYCCMGLMGLKSENEKKGVWKKDDTINVLYAPNKPALPEKLWTSLKCHTSPPTDPWGHISLPHALHGLGGGDEWHFRLRMDIYVHDPGFDKGARIQKKHMSLL